MKRLFLAGAALAAALALGVTTAQALPHGVRITSLRGHVTQGGQGHLNASVPGHSRRCSLTARYANGNAQHLGRKRSKAHRVSWTWRVPAGAAVGKARAQVSCAGLATRGRAFAVERRLAPASITVTDSGLTQVPDGFDSGTAVSYGLVLVNSSADEDARDVQVGVNLLDAAGNAVATDTQILLGGVAAGGTFYLGGQVFTDGPTAVTHLAAFIKIGESTPRSLVAPVVSNLRQSADDFDGSLVLDGDVTNEGTSNLSEFAEISAVFFGGAGNVIGGGSTYPPFTVPPGAQTAFDIETSPGPQASAVSQVRVSVDPLYDTP